VERTVGIQEAPEQERTAVHVTRVRMTGIGGSARITPGARGMNRDLQGSDMITR
jgi:hypothetical protein